MGIPPDKNHLEALAGWALFSSNENCSDQQTVALADFKDGCVNLSGVIEDLPFVQKAPVASEPQPQEEEVAVTVPISMGDSWRIMEHAEVLGPLPPSECPHAKFDIKTQKCVRCGTTYLKAKNRKPELF